ncbi:heavy metal translocating P-type ATPase [soil metagenome]
MTTQTLTDGSTEAAINVDGMTCASCVAHVQKAAQKVPGVRDGDVTLSRGRAVVRFDPSQTDLDHIAKAVTDAGYHADAEDTSSPAADVEQQRIERQHRHAESWKRRAIVGVALWLPVELIHWTQVLLSGHAAHAGISAIEWLALVSSTIAIVYVGAAFYRNAFAAAKRGTTDMDTLIAMGSSVAYGYSLVALIGFLAGWWQTLPSLYFMEASGLLALISLGHWMESRARASAGRAIHELLNLTPATAHRLTPSPGTSEDGAGEDRSQSEGASDAEEVPVADLQPRDLILIRPGDRVPIDGLVVSGRSSVDESMISGESLPVARSIGDEVIGGTINHDGALTVRVTKVGSETALAQIVQLVERAQSSKPEIQRLADRIAAIFVPTVLLIALATAIGWFAWGTAHHWSSGDTWGMIARAVCSVLIIACPCALGLAVPATLMVATGRGAKLGILFRDIDALQASEHIDTVVLDKTGTLTRGKPVVTSIQTLAGLTEADLLKLAASAESFSEHPLAKAIVIAARERGIQFPEPSSFKSEPGLGIRATVDGQIILVGSESMLGDTNGSPVPDAAHGPDARVTGSAVYIGRESDGRVERIGLIRITDEVKPDSAAAVEEFHRMNLRTVLLTGDNRATAEAIARPLKIGDVRAGVKPGGKAQVIQELQSTGSRVAMVGDGINDAPALATADLGIAIGSGSDIAKETGGIVLVGGSVRGVATSIRLGRATMRKVRQNLFLAFIYNILAIPLAAFGLLNPLIAAAAMALSDVTVIGNALRLRRTNLDR